jgi:hypothetical protein
MENILTDLNQKERVQNLHRRLQKLNPTTDKHECVYDVWTQRWNGQRVAFGLCVYSCDAPGNVPVVGMEMCFSTSVRRVEKACQKIKETIWMPADLVASREEYAKWDREDGIAR